MDICYLYNSGFSIETGDDALIIDYYRGRLGRPWRAPLDKQPSGYRDVYVFASHIHGDHYSPEIFDWLSERADIHYILSEDIRPAVPGALLRNASSNNKGNVQDHRYSIDFIDSGGRLRVGSLEVSAYGSTDAGVSFHITTEGGASIFHAGDLNYWHWRDESTEAEVAEAFAMFSREMGKISNGINNIDVAFFPVDPRMGSDYYRGAVLFCEAMRPELLIPMHFSSEFAPPPEFYKELSAVTRIIHAGPDAGKLIMPEN